LLVNALQAIHRLDFKRVNEGLLVQDADLALHGEMKTVTKRAPTDKEMQDLLFTWRVAKFVKSNAIVLTLIGLIATMAFSTLGYALKQLGVPQKIIHLLLMSYRYIFVIEQEYQRLIRAAKIRGFQPKTNLHTYRTYAFVIGMLLVRATARAQRVHQAMLCRGFNGTFYSLHEYKAGAAGIIFSVLMTGVILVLVMMEW